MPRVSFRPNRNSQPATSRSKPCASFSRPLLARLARPSSRAHTRVLARLRALLAPLRALTRALARPSLQPVTSARRLAEAAGQRSKTCDQPDPSSSYATRDKSTASRNSLTPAGPALAGPNCNSLSSRAHHTRPARPRVQRALLCTLLRAHARRLPASYPQPCNPQPLSLPTAGRPER